MANFQISKKLNTAIYTLIVLGIIGVALSIFTDHTPWHARTWSNILHNGVFFYGIALGALVFVSVHAIGYGGWHTYFRRVPENMTRFLPVAGLFIVAIMIGAWMHKHHLYHWAEPGITDVKSANYDKIIAGKAGMLNLPFWSVRMLLMIGTFSAIAFLVRRIGKQEDQAADLNHLKRRRILGALAFMFFMVFGSFQAWDWLMSIDTHWYSTMYSWYTLASMFVSGIAAMTLIVVYLKMRGYLPQFNETHLHDLGKFMFAFSVFWTYLWFSQYMLYWYANIPEETIYFKFRLDNYRFLFYLNLILNFVIPFGVLLANTTKRRYGTIVIMAVVILIGHWLDFYLMVKPGTAIAASHSSEELHHYFESTKTKLPAIELGHTTAHAANTAMAADDHHATSAEPAHAGAHGEHHGPDLTGLVSPGLIEILISLGFVGLFMLVVFQGLAKGNLIPKNDPYLIESEHHH